MIGVDYYPEHWDKDLNSLPQMKKDLKIMKENGIELIRVGEFTWYLLENNEGDYDFTFLDRIFEETLKMGIQVMLGTPSATPPAWLIRKHPEILQNDENGNIRNFGSRRHYCYNSHIYKVYVDKLVNKLAERYGKMENLFAWQIDNEFGCENTTFCYCKKCDQSFQRYLEDKYLKIDRLNEDWGTVFWSQQYNEFYQIETPKKTNALKNPHQLLDFYRFSTKSIMRFAQMQIDIIKKYSDKPITHNLMSNFLEIDYRKMASQYDFISFDNYYHYNEYKPWYAAMNFDLMWSLQRKAFTVVEQQPGRVNWQERNMYYPAKWMETVSDIGMEHGADNIVYFRYRAVPFGSEQYHNGILNYDGDPKTSKRLEVCRNMNGKRFKKREGKARIAMYFDYEIAWMHMINGVATDFDYFLSLFDLYKPFYENGEPVDFIFRDSDFSGYEAIIMPYAIHVPTDVSDQLERTEAKVLFTCMYDIKDERSHIRSERPLGLNTRGISFEITDFGAIYDKNIRMTERLLKADKWFEEHRLKAGNAIADYLEEPFIGNSPIILSEDKRTLYAGTVLEAEGWKALYKRFEIL
ncbi:MAG TPA: beta-galactosidase [Thermotogota bacterium]|nr:beta-galactosidase [Thermotogota bacterium]HPJ89335.1 beta-galactosidase [Thermotogota bacterium]HPR97150.1 beta-galactosidase [Thermotogota bacterium]